MQNLNDDIPPDIKLSGFYAEPIKKIKKFWHKKKSKVISDNLWKPTGNNCTPEAPIDIKQPKWFTNSTIKMVNDISTEKNRNFHLKILELWPEIMAYENNDIQKNKKQLDKLRKKYEKEHSLMQVMKNHRQVIQSLNYYFYKKIKETIEAENNEIKIKLAEIKYFQEHIKMIELHDIIFVKNNVHNKAQIKNIDLYNIDSINKQIIIKTNELNELYEKQYSRQLQEITNEIEDFIINEKLNNLTMKKIKNAIKNGELNKNAYMNNIEIINKTFKNNIIYDPKTEITNRIIDEIHRYILFFVKTIKIEDLNLISPKIQKKKPNIIIKDHILMQFTAERLLDKNYCDIKEGEYKIAKEERIKVEIAIAEKAKIAKEEAIAKAKIAKEEAIIKTKIAKAEMLIKTQKVILVNDLKAKPANVNAKIAKAEMLIENQKAILAKGPKVPPIKEPKVKPVKEPKVKPVKEPKVKPDKNQKDKPLIDIKKQDKSDAELIKEQKEFEIKKLKLNIMNEIKYKIFKQILIDEINQYFNIKPNIKNNDIAVEKYDLDDLLNETEYDYDNKLITTNLKKLLKCDNKYKLISQKIENLLMNIYELQTTKEPASKCIVKQVFFTKKQKLLFNKCWDAYRFLYNNAVAYRYTLKYAPSISDLRNKFVKNSVYEIKNKWLLEFPFDFRDEVMRDLIKDLKSIDAINKEKNKNYILSFKTRKRSRKQLSFNILGKHWNKQSGFWPKIASSHNIKPARGVSEKLPLKPKYTMRLIKTASNKFFICIPQPLNKTKIKPENKSSIKMIFIDPGVKNFLVGYDPSGKIITYGKADHHKIALLLYYKSKLQGGIDKEHDYRRRKRMRIAYSRLCDRIKNLINDLHKKVAKWLCDSYTHIFIPRLNCNDMRKGDSRSAAKLRTYAHCSFVDRLKNKAREYENCKVIEVNESYTSKTCCCCGAQHPNLQNKNVYECRKCGISISRDINGAINICIRYFTNRAKLEAQ